MNGAISRNRGVLYCKDESVREGTPLPATAGTMMIIDTRYTPWRFGLIDHGRGRAACGYAGIPN